MKYFKLDWNTEGKKYSFVDELVVSEHLHAMFDRGVPLASEAITMKVVNLAGEFPDILVGGPVSPIVSLDFVATLRETVDASEFQTLDVDVSNRSIVPEYFFLNVLNCEDAVDETRSELHRLPADIFPEDQDKILSAETLVIDERRLGDRKIFRLAKMRTAVFVREDLKIEIERTCRKGVRFEELA